MPRFALTVVLCLGFCFSNAQASEDSLRNKISERLVSAISRSCYLTDSAKQKISNAFYELLIEIKKIRSANTNKLICAQKIKELRMAFEDDLKQNFGDDVYKCYKKLITSTPTVPRTKMQNRITERTRE